MFNSLPEMLQGHFSFSYATDLCTGAGTAEMLGHRWLVPVPHFFIRNVYILIKFREYGSRHGMRQMKEDCLNILKVRTNKRKSTAALIDGINNLSKTRL